MQTSRTLTGRTMGERFPALAQHVAMKIAHHASENGVYDPLLAADGGRFWVATPYNLKDGLPQFGERDGPRRVLQGQPEFYLTGLPRAHYRQMDAPCEATFRELQEGMRPRAVPFTLPGGSTGAMAPSRSDVCCYVIAAITPDGTCEVVSCGPGSGAVSGDDGSRTMPLAGELEWMQAKSHVQSAGTESEYRLRAE